MNDPRTTDGVAAEQPTYLAIVSHAESELALQLSREHTSDVRPEILRWAGGDSSCRDLVLDFAVLRTHLVAARAGWRLPKDAVAIAVLDVVGGVDGSIDVPSAEKCASHLGMRKSRYLALVAACRDQLGRALRSGLERFAAVRSGPWEPADGDTPHTGLMSIESASQTTAEPTDDRWIPVLPKTKAILRALRDRVVALLDEKMVRAAGHAIDWLPEVDRQQSYPKGTFAIVCGGIATAEVNTEPFTEDPIAAGWKFWVLDIGVVFLDDGEPRFEIASSDRSLVFDVPLPPAPEAFGELHFGRALTTEERDACFLAWRQAIVEILDELDSKLAASAPLFALSPLASCIPTT